MLITSFWVSFIEIYAFLRILRVWDNPLVQIGSFSTPVQIGFKKDTLRDKSKCPSNRGVRSIEVTQNFYGAYFRKSTNGHIFQWP